MRDREKQTQSQHEHSGEYMPSILAEKFKKPTTNLLNKQVMLCIIPSLLLESNTCRWEAAMICPRPCTRRGPAPAHTRLACDAQRALLPVAVGSMNIQTYTTRQLNILESSSMFQHQHGSPIAETTTPKSVHYTYISDL